MSKYETVLSDAFLSPFLREFDHGGIFYGVVFYEVVSSRIQSAPVCGGVDDGEESQTKEDSDGRGEEHCEGVRGQTSVMERTIGKRRRECVGSAEIDPEIAFKLKSPEPKFAPRLFPSTSSLQQSQSLRNAERRTGV